MYHSNKQYLWLAGALALVVLIFTGAVIGGVVGYVAAGGWRSPVSEPIQQSMAIPAVTQAETVASMTTELPSVALTGESASVAAVEKALPAVVTVLVRGGFGGGSGSGFFISQEGYVVTNNHVVEGAGSIAIVYAKGGTAPAELIGLAPEFDLAVLRVDGPVPAVADWGDSRQVPLGSQVIAIGSALGQYQNSVTSGVLSGFNRQLAGMSGLLQTDAAINQGNSGGPLINMAGQVIGINSLVARGRGDAEGLGFAIPSNIAQNVVRKLIETGDARHPFMGIQYQPLNPQLANELGLSTAEGALLESVVDGSPAARAGLRAGDVIIAINGEPVDDRQPLVSLLLEHVAGETLTLDVLRDGQILQTQVTLGERA